MCDILFKERLRDCKRFRSSPYFECLYITLFVSVEAKSFKKLVNKNKRFHVFAQRINTYMWSSKFEWVKKKKKPLLAISIWHMTAN